MKPAFTLGLRSRLLLLFFAAFTVMLGMLAWNILENRREDIDAANEKVWHSVKLIAAEQKGIVKDADQLLLALIRLPQLRPDRSPKECSSILSEWKRAEAPFFNIALVKTNGDVACMVASMTPPINVADRAYFQQALKTHDLVIGGVVVSRSTGKSTITFARGVWDDDAEHASGVVFASLDLSWLNRELAKTDISAGANVVVTDSHGTILGRYPDPERWVGKSAAELPMFKLSTGKSEGVGEASGLAGTRRIFAFTPLLDTIGGPVYLWIGIPKDVVMGPVEHEMVSVALISLTLLVATFGMLWLGAGRWFLRPVFALSGAAQRIRQGDLTARAGLDYADNELGKLARSFDEMAEGIQSKESQLRQVNRALRVLSAGNRTLLRSKFEQDLIEEMCQVIVHTGDYRLAWVAYADHNPEQSVRIVAAWGAERNFLDGVKITWDETESGRGPTGTAIRRGVPIRSNDVAADPDYSPWREVARRHGFGSSLALPLRLGDTIIGALSICAAEPDAFDDAVVELLSEAADDLAFGIAKHRAEIEHSHTRAALQTAEEHFRAAAEAGVTILRQSRRLSNCEPLKAAKQGR